MRLFKITLLFGLLAVALAAGTKETKSKQSTTVAATPSSTTNAPSELETTTSVKDKRQVHGTRTIQLQSNPVRSRFGPGRHNRYNNPQQYQQQKTQQQPTAVDETIYGSGSVQQPQLHQQQNQDDIPPEYLAYFQQQEKLLHQQQQQVKQQQPQQYQVTDEIEQQDIQYIEPQQQQQQQPEYVSYKTGQQQVISEDEYLDLIRKSQEVQRPQQTEGQISQQYHQPNQLEKGPVQYNQQKKYQKYAGSNGQSPFGESSLEKEAERLEEENRKSLAEFSAEILAREQKQQHHHHPAQQYQQEEVQHIVHHHPKQKHQSAQQYLTEVSESAAPIQAQHTRQYVQYQEAETQQAYKHQPQQHQQRIYEGAPKVHYQAQSPSKAQYFQTSEQISVEQPEGGKQRPNNAVKIVEPPQLQYEKPFQLRQYQKYQQPSVPQAHALQRPAQQKYHPHQAPVPSRSAIFVSQGTGINKPAPQYNQGERQQVRPENTQRIPLPANDRPLTQEEFQALVDAGYKVTAIPVPVPVPVSAEKYQQEQQKQRQKYAAQTRVKPQYVERPNGGGYRHNIDVRLAGSESYARPYFKAPANAHMRPKN